MISIVALLAVAAMLSKGLFNSSAHQRQAAALAIAQREIEDVRKIVARYGFDALAMTAQPSAPPAGTLPVNPDNPDWFVTGHGTASAAFKVMESFHDTTRGVAAGTPPGRRAARDRRHDRVPHHGPRRARGLPHVGRGDGRGAPLRHAARRAVPDSQRVRRRQPARDRGRACPPPGHARPAGQEAGLPDDRGQQPGAPRRRAAARLGPARGGEHRMRRLRRDEGGFVMVTAIVLMAITLTIAAVAIDDTIGARGLVTRDARVHAAQQAADAGVQIALYRANQMKLGKGDFNGGAVAPDEHAGLPRAGHRQRRRLGHRRRDSGREHVLPDATRAAAAATATSSTRSSATARASPTTSSRARAARSAPRAGTCP